MMPDAATAFIADWPVADAQKARLVALFTDRRDVLPPGWPMPIAPSTPRTAPHGR